MPWLKSCLSQKPTRKKPAISPPLHLLLKLEGESQNHAFRNKVFKKPRPCHLCHQPIHQLGSCCRVCKYVCHTVCETKATAARYEDTALRIFQEWQRLQMDTFPSVANSAILTANELPYSKDVQLKSATKGKQSSQQPNSIETPGNLNLINNNISSIPNNNNNSSSKSLSMAPRGMQAGSTALGPGFAVSSMTGTRKETMDLRYITERIIALYIPADVGKAAYSHAQKQAATMLRTKHGENYTVLNLSAPRRALRHHHSSVRELGWPRDLAPPLERLCSICKDMDSWLKGDSRRIAVVHSQGGKDRIGVVVAAYMHYSHICGGADQALDRFAMKRFLQDHVDDVKQPSHRRYVDYFSGLLSGSIRINSAPLYLTHVTVLGAPSFEPHAPEGPDPGGGGGALSTMGGCRAFLKVYEGLVPVHTSAVYCVAGDARAFTVNVAAERGRRGLQLRGDVLVKCYHRHYRKRVEERDAREIVFACQFHTCAVTDYTLSFTRSELDSACDDLRFPLDGAVELHFSPTPEIRLPSPAPTPAVPTLDSSDDPVTRWDSYDHLYEHSDDDQQDDPEAEVNHTLGPLDGSLYATIGRKQQLQMQQEQRRRQLMQQQEQHHQLHLRRAQQRLQQSDLMVGSEHTASMDSGISSAGINGVPLQTASPDDKQRALDELLNDMLLTVESIPDLKPTASVRTDLQRCKRAGVESRYYRPAAAAGASSAHAGAPPPRRQSSLAPVRDAYPVIGRAASGPPCLSRLIETSLTSSPAAATTPNTDDDGEEIPYHARPDGRPFTYVPGAANDSAMLHTQPGLSSPSLVRKAGFKGASNGTANGYATSTPRQYSNGTSRSFDEYARTQSGSRSPEPLLDCSGPGGGSGHGHGDVAAPGRSQLTWLQRQQLKLRERREGALRSARLPHETRLLSELRCLHNSNSASRRADGYTSDTTMFADEDDDDLCRPLHINTGKLNGGLSAPGSPLQRRPAVGQSPSQHQPYPLSRQKSDSSFDRERPFIKRGYEPRKYHESTLPSPLINSHAPPITPRTSSRTFLNHVNGVGTVGSSPSPDLSLLDAIVDEPDLALSRETRVQHQDALACLMASLASPSSSPTSSLSMTPSPPAQSAPGPGPASACLNGHISHFYARPSNASDCSTNSTASCAWQATQREESYSSWRVDDSGSPRPNTPAFPVQPRTPYSNNGQFDSAALPPKSPTTQRRLNYSGSFKSLRRWPSNSSVSSKDRSPSPSPLSDHHSQGVYAHSPKSPITPNGGQASPTIYSMHSRRSSTHSSNEPPQEVAAHHVKFVRDTSRYWYKPNISREEAIAMLKDAPPGTFVVRDSNSFPGAFGMALKVAIPPATVQQKAAFFSGDSSELVRHFLIEPTSRGVKLKGCSNEPVFSSLSALVYQHSLMAMALPCKLLLPDGEINALSITARHVTDLGSSPTPSASVTVNSAQQLLAQGAACNVLYLFTTDTESLTGPQAIKRAIHQLFMSRPLPLATVVHFKVSSQGITLTDNKRRLFFRRHYPVSTISHCGLDPDDHRWSQKSPDTGMPISSNRCFGFVARKPASRSDNQCHIFAELEPEQPANAIVNFVCKVMMSGASKTSIV